MVSALFLSLSILASPADLPWQDLALSIEKDHSTSSDTVTLCRVRVVNHGAHTWPGRAVRFEAMALDGGVVMARERGRFGLSISPHGTLETLIAFNGLYDASRSAFSPRTRATRNRRAAAANGRRNPGRSARPARMPRT